MYEYKAKYIKNYDGDTIDFRVSLGFGIKLDMRVRLSGVDTPELRGGTEETKAKGYKAKEFVENALKNANSIILKTEKDKKGKYGRYLGEVFVINGNMSESLNKLLLEHGLAIKWPE